MQEAGAYGSRGTRRDFGEQAAVLTCPPVHQPQTPCRKTPATHARVWWISQHGCPHDPRTHGMTPARMTCTGTRLTIECREVSPFLWRVWAVAARFTRAADCWLRHWLTSLPADKMDRRCGGKGSADGGARGVF